MMDSCDLLTSFDFRFVFKFEFEFEFECKFIREACFSSFSSCYCGLRPDFMCSAFLTNNHVSMDFELFESETPRLKMAKNLDHT